MTNESALITTSDQQLASPATIPASTPEEVVERAVRLANVLTPIIKSKKLSKKIGERDHVYAEAWAALLGLMNVDPVPAWCRKLDRDGETIYEARMELYKGGQLIGAGEAIASSKEGAQWARSEHGIKSMAQTRALGKAARLKFAWIMVLAGYAPTPAEEMPEEDRPSVHMPRAKPVPIAAKPVEPVETTAEPEGSKLLGQLFKAARAKNFEPEHMKAAMKVLFGKDSSKQLTDTECAKLIKAIESGEVRT